MSKAHTSKGALYAGAAVLLASAAGCSSVAAKAAGGIQGGGSPGPAAAAAIQAAMAKASADKTVRITGSITSPAGGGRLDGQERFGDPAEMSMHLNVAGQDITELLVGGELYMKDQMLSAELGGKPWIKLSLAQTGSAGSAVTRMLASGEGTDPARQLEPLLASGDLAKVGTETVDGVRADHYHGTLDPATALDSSQASKNLAPAQLAQLKSLMKAGGVTGESVDVWVGADGLPVRETVSTTTAAGLVKTDLHLAHWGEPVSFAAPPADQVSDMSSMMGALPTG